MLLATCYLLLTTSKPPEARSTILLTTYYLLLTTYYVLLTIYYLLLATYYLLLATYYLLLATYYLLLTACCLLLQALPIDEEVNIPKGTDLLTLIPPRWNETGQMYQLAYEVVSSPSTRW